MWPPLFQNFADTCASNNFFGIIPPWYEYLISSGMMSSNKVTGACELAGSLTPNDWVQVVFLVVLAVLDMALRLAGVIAIGYIVYGGIQYVTSQGEPDKTKDAQQTIINALIGLSIAMVAAAFVSFIGTRLG
jgi:Type IV secretion system pilin